MLEINVLHRTTVQSRGCKAVTVTHLTTFPFAQFVSNPTMRSNLL